MSLDSDKKWTINVIGAGNLAKPYVFKLAEKIANGNESIKRVNWWVRDYKTGEGITHREDLESTLEQNLTGYLKENNTKAYTQAIDKIKVRGFRNLEDLKKIVEASQKQNFVKESDLTLILTRYDLSFLFKNTTTSYSDTILKELVPKNAKEIAAIGKERVILEANTLRYVKRPAIHDKYPEFGYTECIENLLKIQKQVLNINEALEGYCKEINKEHFRLNGLAYTLIGNQALAQALEGYEGTIINMINPVEISNYQFAAHSKIPANKIFAPVENDYTRFTVFILQAYKDIFGKSFKGELTVPPILGPHNEFIYADQKQIFFDKISFDKMFAGNSPNNIFDQIIEKTRTYGINYAKTHGKAPEDTVYNSLITTTNILLKSEDTPIRGCVYDKDNKIFTGAQFILQNEKIALIKRNNLGMSQKLIEQLEKSVQNDKELQEYLTNSKGAGNILKEYKPKQSEIPKILIEGIDWKKKTVEKSKETTQVIKTVTKSGPPEFISIGDTNNLDLESIFSKYKTINIQPIKPDSWEDDKYFEKHLQFLNTEIHLPVISKRIDFNINILEKGKLVLSPGTELEFDKKANICGYGTIIAEGKSTNNIIFKGRGTKIYFQGDLRLKYCTIKGESYDYLFSKPNMMSPEALNASNYANNKIHIEKCQIYENLSSLGAMIIQNYEINIIDNIIKENTAGLNISNCTGTIANNNIYKNINPDLGAGGLWIGNSNINFENNHIHNNSVSCGGGINIINSRLFGNNNIIEFNKADTGGGVYIDKGSFLGSSNTVRYNTAKEQGGIRIESGIIDCAVYENYDIY